MYVGIDVSKNKSQVCIVDEKQKVLNEFSINHDKEGFEELEKYLTPESKIGMETTGNYSKAIYAYLKAKYNVTYVDNMQMYNFARLNSLTIKNDTLDARAIAKFMCYDYKRINPMRVDELKDLVQLYHKFICQRAKYKVMCREQTNIIFPEVEKLCKISHAKGMKNLLYHYSSPQEIANATFDELEKALLEKLDGRGKYGVKFINKLQEHAKNSIGVKDYPTTCYKYTLKILSIFEDLIDELKDKMIIKLMDTPYYRLLDKDCYDVISLSKIVGEVGDIRRFPSHKKFVGYCGLNVTEKQSGNSIWQNQHITKHGDMILRSTFYEIAFVNVHHKKGLEGFYQRLKEKGKHAKKAMTACARKFAVWTYYEMKKCH